MNYLDIVNSVLRRIREGEVNSVAQSEYSTIIGDFVKATKREVESGWNWTTLRTSVEINTVQSTAAYSITGAGKRYVLEDVYNKTNKLWLNRLRSDIGRRDITEADEGQPSTYFMEGIDASGDPKINFVAVPDGVYVIDVNLVVPQTDSPADSDEIIMDEWPIILGAYAKAIAERGEDSGQTSGEANAAYKLAVADSVAQDFARLSGEDCWHV